MSELVELAVADRVATLTLNRPEKLNAFKDDMRDALVPALDRVAADAEVRVLVITGAGRAFSAGGDIQHMADLKSRDASYEEFLPMLEAGRLAARRLAALPIPTLAAINGPAAGGGLNLALGCDLRIASDRAVLGETFVRLGLHIDWGGAYHLPRLVGLAKALELCWLGELIDAQEALRIGLVNRVVAHEQFADEVRAVASRLASAPQTSVRLTKRTLTASLERSLAECLETEIDAQRSCWASADVAEGTRAFLEKRSPRFTSEALASGATRFE
ncbi:MAG TPA: enoyl-CoA hydratase-related protein [Candidatus Eisenbacteria bacterium]|nr:enoyl-CoA hydratase-related protein [Candidatus Eisenbacteria bacterium]